MNNPCNSKLAHPCVPRSIGTLWLVLLLLSAFMLPARASTPTGAVPFGEIGARATAGYQGDALGVTATADGARLRCGFQKLEGHATREGLWLESTKPGGGQLRLVAVAVGRGANRACQCALTEAVSSARSGMSIVTVPHGNQAPLGATWTHGAASFFDMPLLTELETPSADAPFYRHAAPNGAVACLRHGAQTLARTGQVSVDDKLVRFTRPGLTEEYSVSVDGVRQDFVIESPPLNPQRSTLNQSAGDLRLELALSGARAKATASGASLRLDGSGRALAYSRLCVEDATGRELTARLEVLSPDRLAVTVADANATYPVRIDPTFSDADWVSLNPGLPGANGDVAAIAVDGSGNVYVGGDFSLVGTVPANHIAKWDGSAWSALGSGVGGPVFALAVSGTTLYAGGILAGVAKWDGSAWSTLGSGVNNEVYALAVSGTNLYAGGSFIVKWDGSAWSLMGSGNGTVFALAVSGTNLYAGGEFTVAGGVWATNIARWNGSAWSALGSGVNSDVFALAASGTDLYAGGWFTNAGGVPANYIAKWNGSTWSALASGVSGSPGALVVSGTNLYAGGNFTTAGGVPANDIAKWDGSAWSALSSGMVGIDGTVSAVAMSGTVLYAGGEFTWAGRVPANHIVKWDGSAWSALGSGVNGAVNALTVSGTNLYTAGSFSTAGGVPANNVAKWNGSAWSALGSGMGSYSSSQPYYVYALAVSGTNLYAGGGFDTAGGVSANNIAKWDGSAWSALGSGMKGWVYALTVSGTDLYAGGNFIMAGGVPANYIARWNGSAWSALGSGVNGTVYALAVSGTDLFAAGYFTTAGEVPANHIALCHGSVWSALGSGLDGTVYALAMSGTDLYAAGHFPTAGGVLANNIAAWNWSAWSALGSGVSGGGDYSLGDYSYGLHPVNALVADGVGHLFVGGNFLLAGTNLSPHIAQADVGGVPTNRPPVIIDSPASLAVASGATAEFQVEVIGSPPLIYKWVFNGTNAIAGATSAILSLTNVQLTQAGAYGVTVSNLCGTVTSAPALLQVFPRGIVVTNSEIALREAMTGGGTVTFACDGTITLASTITIAADTTLDAGGHQVTISGNSAVRVFYVNSNVDFTLINLTVANGSCSDSLGGAGIFNGGGTVNATSVAFASNSVVTNGYAQGGAIRNELGTLNLEGCSFANNQVWAVGPSPVPVALGGAIYNNGTMNARACIFSANSAGARPYPQFGRDRQEGGQAAGGAVYSPGIARFEGCRFDANVAAGGRGGVFISECCIPTGVVDGADGGTGSGGAICNQGWLSVRTSSFMFNQAVGADGGDAYSDRSYWPASGASGGRGGSGYGAALDNEGTASIASSMFSGNNALGGSGGAACMGGGGPAEPGGSGGVGGDASGAAVFNGGSIDLVNCTIVKSGAVGGGGGGGAPGSKPTEGMAYGPGGSGGSGGGGGCANGPIWSASGQVGVTNCTIALNSGQAGLGGPGGAGGPATQFPPYVTNFPSGPDGANGMIGTAIGGGVGVQLLNTLIASDSPSNFFVATDCGHNLNSDASCAFTNSGSLTNTDPKLGPLADNGGPTPTMALLPGSPAIDAGNTALAPATDQRGFSRPAGAAADIGAFEYGSVMPTVAVSLSGTTGVNILAAGNTGRTCRLLWSPNFSSWVPLATNQIGSGGTVLFYDTYGPADASRFYRLVMP